MASKPKVGRPKHYRPHDVKLVLPKHAMKYQAKRLYWALIEMEKKMSKDITSVKMNEYTNLLQSYVEVVEALKKQGITYGTKTSKSGVVKGRLVDLNTERMGSEGSSEDRQAGVGVGVRTSNPIT